MLFLQRMVDSLMQFLRRFGISLINHRDFIKCCIKLLKEIKISPFFVELNIYLINNYEKQMTTNINIFVPALALQHVCNPEDCSRLERIKLAIRRFHLTGDMFNPIHQRQDLYVFIKRMAFKKEPLGYAIEAVINSVDYYVDKGWVNVENPQT